MRNKAMRVGLWLCFLTSNSAFSAPKPDQPASRDAFFAKHTIPRIRIQLDAEALAALRNKFREYTRATVMEGTNTWRDVGIHLKGQYGTFQGIDGRPSLTLNFDKYIKEQRFHGLDKLHLNNSAQDPSYLCEMIGRQIFEAAEVPVARASHARVELNGRDLGLFVLVEGLDRTFLKRHFANADGNLYDSGFRHDITDPLKKSGGKGPDDHSDLRTLAAAAGELNHANRLARLARLLDLDRFYTTIALESLVRHHDGYAMGINNYWVYVNPEGEKPPAIPGSSRREEAQFKRGTQSAERHGRAVFLPHGMDQLFFEPRAGLLPDLRGMLAQAVLETQGGRKEFRARCVTLCTNLFPSLSNRVAKARLAIRPMLTELDPKTVRHADEAATNLLVRIQERYQQLQRAVFPPSPRYPRPSDGRGAGGEGNGTGEGGLFPLFGEAPAFDPKGVARLTDWLATVEGGRATFAETNNAGQTVLQVRVGSSDHSQATLGRWEKSVLLTVGTYRFSAKVTADQPVFRGPRPPVALRIWGVSDVQLETSRPDPQTMEFQCTFEVSPENIGEHLVQCEARGKEASTTYQFSSVQLAKVE